MSLRGYSWPLGPEQITALQQQPVSVCWFYAIGRSPRNRPPSQPAIHLQHTSAMIDESPQRVHYSNYLHARLSLSDTYAHILTCSPAQLTVCRLLRQLLWVRAEETLSHFFLFSVAEQTAAHSVWEYSGDHHWNMGNLYSHYIQNKKKGMIFHTQLCLKICNPFSNFLIFCTNMTQNINYFSRSLADCTVLLKKQWYIFFFDSEKEQLLFIKLERVTKLHKHRHRKSDCVQTEELYY